MVSDFEWTTERSHAAIALAEGQTQQQIARDLDITDRTIRNWLAEPVFAAEVDRLSLMVGIASRAERLRMAQRVIRQKVREDGTLITDRDLLEWVKFAQSETDGAKLDLGKLAALAETETPVAHTGPVGVSDTPETVN